MQEIRDLMLTIGKLAKRAHMTPVTIRYYEKRGLISTAHRSGGGHRAYSECTLHRLHFIQNAQAAGFTLDEIQELLAIQDQPHASSQHIRACVISKIHTIQDKINALKHLQIELEAMAAACDGKVPLAQCPILNKLYDNKESK
jgi:DNA-binding transcriptional MerR regulator